MLQLARVLKLDVFVIKVCGVHHGDRTQANFEKSVAAPLNKHGCHNTLQHAFSKIWLILGITNCR